MELAAAALIFGAVFFLVLALGSSQRETIRSRLATLREQPGTGMPGSGESAGPSVSDRIMKPLMRAPVDQLRSMLPTRMLEGVQRKLILAGEPMTLNSFLTFQIVSAGAFLALPVLVVVAMGFTISVVPILVIVGFAAVGVALPHMWLRQRVGQRQSQIIKGLPDAFDLITTCVEAGLGLDAALARVSEKIEGPFADELRRALRDISLGKMRREALKELGERTGVPDLMTFVNAVIQAEQMGSSVGAVLRVQSEQLRVRRRQRAEEQAYKAPVKMIFPLVLCIFPTLFIVILGPAGITIMNDFPGS